MSPLLSTLQSIFLTVAIAADLAPLKDDLLRAMRKNEPNLEVRFVIGASATLAQQIQNGAPYDVFMSANTEYVDRLASFRRVYAVGHPAIRWKDEKTHPLSDLKADWVRSVALPNPKLAPYGVAAVKALQQAGLWDFVRQKAIYGENVRQTLQLFESGNTDAVITSATLLPGAVRLEIDVVQEAGAISAKEAAREFVRKLTTPDVQAVFKAHGFDLPKSGP
jgi:molybdate transport system substrate-binding protein